MLIRPIQLKLYQPACYRICIQGVVDESWAASFADLTITYDIATGPCPVTILTGQVIDQAMLLGVLNALYGLGLCLLWVECLMEGVGSANS